MALMCSPPSQIGEIALEASVRIVVAPDKFKGSVTAQEAAENIAMGIRDVIPDAQVILAPVADGGEGTVDAAVSAGYGLEEATVTGPVGEPVVAQWARNGTHAVVEMSLASGLAALPVDKQGEPILAATTASSQGTGELIARALDAGCTHIILGVGGSANTDGGAGMLVGLGARLLDAAGKDLPGGGGALTRLGTVDLSGLHPGVAEANFLLAADVDNPLTGERGAAAVFGPQKGASRQDVKDLDAALGRWRDQLAQVIGEKALEVADSPGAGAAGGVGYAAVAVLNATRRSGVDVVLELVDLHSSVQGSDLLITGEGSLDEQSLGGKTPVGVLSVGKEEKVPVVAVCGRTTLEHSELIDIGFRDVYALSDRAPDAKTSMREAPRLLQEVGRDIAQKLTSSGSK